MQRPVGLPALCLTKSNIRWFGSYSIVRFCFFVGNSRRACFYIGDIPVAMEYSKLIVSAGREERVEHGLICRTSGNNWCPPNTTGNSWCRGLEGLTGCRRSHKTSYLTDTLCYNYRRPSLDVSPRKLMTAPSNPRRNGL
jgi:hypothetical protein